jgi:hypothetical protein
MASPESNEPPVVDPATPACRYLRSKGMYVYTDGVSGEDHEGYDNTIYWCNQTMKSFGPDDEYVSSDECRCTTRSCYEPL